MGTSKRTTEEGPKEIMGIRKETTEEDRKGIMGISKRIMEEVQGNSGHKQENNGRGSQ